MSPLYCIVTALYVLSCPSGPYKCVGYLITSGFWKEAEKEVIALGLPETNKPIINKEL